MFFNTRPLWTYTFYVYKVSNTNWEKMIRFQLRRMMLINVNIACNYKTSHNWNIIGCIMLKRSASAKTQRLAYLAPSRFYQEFHMAKMFLLRKTRQIVTNRFAMVSNIYHIETEQ
jgi:hypothetical protein